ncbi:Tetracycline resistance protein [Diplonema papillatum]|nr:Tetracycline resistance protein [Diplonema papillatum]
MSSRDAENCCATDEHAGVRGGWSKGKGPSFLAVVPMCLAEFLSFSILRAVVPGMQADAFGSQSYTVEGVTLAVQGVLAFFSCPIFGALSDAYGRRIFLGISAVGALLPVFAVISGQSMFVYQVFVAVSGAFKATLVVVFAYVADTTVGQGSAKRMQAFGVVLATLGFSLSIGPYIGGAAAKAYGNLAAFYMTAALGGLAAMYAFFVLPESRVRRRGAPASFLQLVAALRGGAAKPADPGAHPSFAPQQNDQPPARPPPPHDTSKAVTSSSSSSSLSSPSSLSSSPSTPLRSPSREARPCAAAAAGGFSVNPFRLLASVCSDLFLRRLMVIAFMYYVSYWALVSTIMLYLTQVFNFDVVERGRFLSMIGFCHVISELVLVRILTNWYSFTDRVLMQVGIFAWFVKMLLLAVAKDRTTLDIAALTSLVSGLFGPSLVSLASRAAEPKGKQGEVQGAIAAFRALAEGVGPLLIGFLFSISSGNDGYPYLVSSSIAAAAFFLSIQLPNLVLDKEKIDDERAPAAAVEDDIM